MSASTEDTAARFHTSLNVADLARSAAFYRAFLGRAPAKQMPDYAKFELEEPPLVLSLIPGQSNSGGALNHLGIRLPNSEALIQTQLRLKTAGIRTKREEGVECCHSTQTKFWVTDPDHTLWELYILHEDADQDHEHGVPPPEKTESAPAKVMWQHQIPDPFPRLFIVSSGANWRQPVSTGVIQCHWKTRS